MSNFDLDQDRQLDGSLYNATKKSSGFKTKRFLLDAMATKNDLNGSNFFPFPFKSFWVADTNNKNFTAKMVVNNKGDGGDPLPLRMNMSIPFEYRQAGCALEWPAQAGVWVDIVFAFDSDITPGFTSQDLSGIVTLNEGSSYTDGAKSCGLTGADVLVAANSARKVALIQNNSGKSVWIGTPAKLAGASYQTDCQRLDSGEPTFYWRSASQLNFRTDVGTADIAVMELS